MLPFLNSIVTKKVNNTIRQIRINKEQTLIQDANWIKQDNDIDLIEFNIPQGKGSIQLNCLYPFEQPQIKFQLNQKYYTKKNIEDYHYHDYYFNKMRWTPQLTVNQIVMNCKEHFVSELQIRKTYELDIYSDLCNKIVQNSDQIVLQLFLLLLVLFFNLLIQITDHEFKYLELSLNLDFHEMYRQSRHFSFDQPPLRIYISFIKALILMKFNVFDIEIQTNQLIYHYLHTFMNLFIFYIPVYFILKNQFSKLNRDLQNGIILYLVLSPINMGQLLINQFLLLILITALQNSLWLGSLIYTICINYDTQYIYLFPIVLFQIVGRLAVQHHLYNKDITKINPYDSNGSQNIVFSTIINIVYKYQFRWSQLKYMIIEGIMLIIANLILFVLIWIPFLNENRLFQIIFELYFSQFTIYHVLWIVASIPSILLGIIDQKYISLILLCGCLGQQLFLQTNNFQILGILFLINYQHLKQELNYIIALLPQVNYAYQILYFTYGQQFINRNILNTQKSQIKYMNIKSYFYKMLIVMQIFNIYFQNDLLKQLYNIAFITYLFINGNQIIFTKILKVLQRKNKKD